MLLLFPLASSAQFKEEAFSQNYNSPGDTTSAGEDEELCSVKEFARGGIHRG